MIALIFDVETTGLIKKDSNDNPLIIQLSYMLVDLQNIKVIKTYDTYINIDENIKIPWNVINVTGITHNRCKKGIPIENALEQFYQDVKLCHLIIAHNLNFDSKMIEIETLRCINNNLGNVDLFNSISLENRQKYCTMINNTDLCKIPSKHKEGQYKWPTLSELHAHLFNYVPGGLHDSLVDVKACLRCYIKIHHNLNVDFGNFTNKCFILEN